MTRDFTDEMFKEVVDAITYDINRRRVGVGFAVGLSKVIENCETNVQGIQNSAAMVDKLLEMTSMNQVELIIALRHIIDDARGMDKAIEIRGKKWTKEVGDYHIENLRSMIKLIETPEYSMSTHSFKINGQADYRELRSSIFGKTRTYNNRLEKVPDGLFYEVYKSINPETEEGLKELERLMTKSPKLLKEWELDALAALIDSCVICNEATGNATIDYEKLGKIITAGYTKVSESSTLHNYMTYEITENMAKVIERYNAIYNVKSLMYESMQSPLTKYADVNAILQGISGFYNSVKVINTIDPENPYDEYGQARLLPFGMEVFYDEEEKLIRVSTVQTDYEEINQNPFETNMVDVGKNDIRIICASSENASFIKAIRACDEEEIISISEALWSEMSGNIKSKLKSNTTGKIGKDVLGFTGPYIAAYKKIKGYVEELESASKNNENIRARIKADTYALYCEKLNISGNVIIHNGSIEAANLKMDETTTSIDIQYYNLKENKNLRTEGVCQLFSSFSETGERSGVIEGFIEGLTNGDDPKYGRKIEFENAVRNELKRLGYDEYSATDEEVKLAVKSLVEGK